MLRASQRNAPSRREFLGLASAGLLMGRLEAARGGDDEASGRIYFTAGPNGKAGGELGGVFALDVEAGTWTKVLGERHLFQSVSPDGRWLAQSTMEDEKLLGVFLHDVRAGG